MSGAADPVPQRGVLVAAARSWLQFCAEGLAYDDVTPIRFWETWTEPDWTGVEADELTHIVASSYTALDALALAYYGDEALWWVIAARNAMDMPDIDLYQGRVLKIPHPNWVQTELLPQARMRRQRRG